MGTIVHLATNRFIIARLTPVSGYKSVYATTTFALGTLQPLSGQKTQAYDGVMGKTYALYVDGLIDVQEGDRFRELQTSKVYKVVNGGVSRRTIGAIDYKAIIVQEVN